MDNLLEKIYDEFNSFLVALTLSNNIEQQYYSVKYSEGNRYVSFSYDSKVFLTVQIHYGFFKWENKAIVRIDSNDSLIHLILYNILKHDDKKKPSKYKFKDPDECLNFIKEIICRLDFLN